MVVDNVGGISQWLGRRSLAGGLSRSVPDPWLTFDHSVDKVSAMDQSSRPTQPSIQLRSEMRVIYAITWITGEETFKRQTRLYECRSQSVDVGLDSGLCCTPGLYVTHSAAPVAVCSLWHIYKCFASAFSV